MKQCGLEGREEEYVWQLSGGQTHLLALAGAVSLQPDILILDEPIAQLDPMHADRIYAVLRDLNENHGKTILVTKSKEAQFKSLDDVNQPSVRVMYNPGGTNEKFAKESTPKAQLIMHEQNAEIPGLVGEDKADVMITETMEAVRYVKDNPKVAAPLVDKPFTENHFGVLMSKECPSLLKAVNDWMAGIKADGTMEKWYTQYIK